MGKFNALMLGVCTLLFTYYVGMQMKETQDPTIHNRSSHIDAEWLDLSTAEALTKQNRLEEAQDIIAKYLIIDRHAPLQNKWIELAILTSQEQHHIPSLIKLYQSYPKSFEKNEIASLLVAEGLLANNQWNAFTELREKWKGRESSETKWFLLDVDDWIIKGKLAEALDLLTSIHFEGKADVHRLLRLAFVYMTDQPKTAWAYLSQAQKKDPLNPHVRTYRAKMLEMAGKVKSAESEYLAAAKLANQPVYFFDQLADFYIRHNALDKASEVFQQHLSSSSVDYVWLKGYFWNKVFKPFAMKPTPVKIPCCSKKEFIEYYFNLEPKEFWNYQAFDLLPSTAKNLEHDQTAYWLQTLEALRLNKREEAWNILYSQEFDTHSWNKDLELTLKTVLAHQLRRSFPQERVSENAPVFFQQLQSLKQTDELDEKLTDLVNTSSIYSILFLTAGWNEAALQLPHEKQLPAVYPEWVSYQYTKALWSNRGSLEALEYALTQAPTPALDVLIGELFIQRKNYASALDHLKRAAPIRSENGSKASWLASLIYIDQRDYANAKRMILDHPQLVSTTLGQEGLAQIALLENQPGTAEKIYRSIQKDSYAAKSYLARKAYQEKNWKQARTLTEQLLVQFPDQPLLRKNLDKIQEEERKQNTNPIAEKEILSLK